MNMIEKLASRLDNFMKNYDPYEYAHNDWSIEQTRKTLEESPMIVISELLDIIEEVM